MTRLRTLLVELVVMASLVLYTAALAYVAFKMLVAWNTK